MMGDVSRWTPQARLWIALELAWLLLKTFHPIIYSYAIFLYQFGLCIDLSTHVLSLGVMFCGVVEAMCLIKGKAKQLQFFSLYFFVWLLDHIQTQLTGRLWYFKSTWWNGLHMLKRSQHSRLQSRFSYISFSRNYIYRTTSHDLKLTPPNLINCLIEVGNGTWNTWGLFKSYPHCLDCWHALNISKKRDQLHNQATLV